MTILDKDPFGIQKLYPTSAFGFNPTPNKTGRQGGGSGWEYYSDIWNQLKIYEFVPNDNNLPIENMTKISDTELHYRKVPNSFIKVNGDGSISLNNPDRFTGMKLSLLDKNNLYYGTKNALSINSGKRWTSNVEFTVYFSIDSFATRYGLNGAISIHLTSDHHFLDYASIVNPHLIEYNPYLAHEYFLVMQYDGHMFLGGEPYHGCRRDKRPLNIYDIDFWDTQFKGIPLNNMIGIKFIKRVVDTNKKNVFLEVYRDTSEGYEGGNWQKLFEFKHERGNWYNDTMDTPYALALANASNSILPIPKNVDDPHADGGGGQCYLKIDSVNQINLKWLSCRDIEPDLLPPVTTDAELTTDSEYYDDNEADVL